MSDALRPSSLFTTASPATVPTGVLATVPNPPPEVSQLPAGTTLRGVVIGHDDRGHLLVRTDLGTLAVNTRAHLPPGSEVVLQIRSVGPQLQILLMHSDAAGTRGGGLTAAGGQPPAVPGSHASSPDLLILGQSVRATVQAPATALASTVGPLANTDPNVATALARLAPGSQVVLRIVAVDAPAPGPAGAAPPGPPAGSPPSVSPGAPLAGAASGPAVAGAVASPSPPAGALPATAAGPGASGPQGPTPTVQLGPAAGPASGAAPSVAGQTPAGGTTVPAPVPAPVPAGPAALQPAASPGAALATPPTAASPGTPGGPAATPTAAAGADPLITASPVGSLPPGSAYRPAPGTPQPGPNGPPRATGGGATPPATPATPAAVEPATARAAAPVAFPGTASIDTSTGAAAARFSGLVTASTNAGHPVLQTPVGTLTLEMRAALPVGSRLMFEVLAGSLPRGDSAAPVGLSGTLGRAWPALEEAIQVLHHAAEAAGAPPNPAVVPQPGSRLASGLLFFISALNGGDMGRWLGAQAAQTLKAEGRGGLLSRLGRDFAQLGRQVESGGGDWRLFLIPLLDGQQVQQLRLFERHGSNGRGGAGDKAEGEATRFVLEVELTRLGDLQLDGLVRQRRFDLILRTRQPLPEVMRQDISDIFTSANEATGYTGSIGFQASPGWRFMPIAEPTGAAAGSGLVI